MLTKKTNEDIEVRKHYEQQIVPMQQSILQLEEAAGKMQHSVEELKPFEVNIIKLTFMVLQVLIILIVYAYIRIII